MSNRLDLTPCPSTYAKLILRKWPGQADALLCHTELDPLTVANESTITVRQQLRIFQNIQEIVSNKDWPLEFGRELSINSHGPLGFAAISARTLGDGIAALAEFARIRAPYISAESILTDKHLILRFSTDVYDLGDFEIPMVEILLQVVLAYVYAVLGEDAPKAIICVRHSARGCTSRYQRYFKARCEFNQPFDELRLPASFRTIACPLHDEIAYRTSIIRCREALQLVLAPNDMVARVRHLMAKHFEQISAHATEGSLPRLEKFADSLCVTPRTLIRQLANQGTRFTDLRTEFQLETAGQMLKDARYTVSDIAEMLGYENAANFGRAFRKMAGVSPGEFRRRNSDL